MAAHLAASTTYDTTPAITQVPGWRMTSLMGKITDISPEDYTFFTNSGNVRAKDVRHNWQNRILPVRDFNASNGGANLTRTEGDEYTYEDTAAPVQDFNYTHIFSLGAEVTGTAQAVSYHGIAKLLADQVNYRSRQLKGGIERALWLSTVNDGDATGADARRMGGLRESLITATQTDAGNGTNSISETEYIQVLKAVWDTGATARHVVTNGNLRIFIDTYDANGGIKWIQTTAKEVVNMVLVYQSTFGTVVNLLSRDMDDDLGTGAADGTAELLAIDFSMLKKAWLRPVGMTKPALTGDYMRSVILGELTLQMDDYRGGWVRTAIGLTVAP